MADKRIGIIGGSGLYAIEGLTQQEWIKAETPYGEPSDEILTGVLEGRKVAFLPDRSRSLLLDAFLPVGLVIHRKKRIEVLFLIKSVYNNSLYTCLSFLYAILYRQK